MSGGRDDTTAAGDSDMQVTRSGLIFEPRAVGRGRVPMPGGFEILAIYNAEVTRGIMHTPEYVEKMAELQQDFDRWVTP